MTCPSPAADESPCLGSALPAGMSTRGRFERLLDEHGAAVLGTLHRLCGNSHDAEDLFQETAARVWRHLPGEAELRNPRAWLMTVAHRVFVDKRSRRPAPASEIDTTDGRQAPPDRRAEKAEECDRLSRATQALPATLREVIALHYAGGLSLRETAAAIGISEGTVKSRLHAALAKLRRTLQ